MANDMIEWNACQTNCMHGRKFTNMFLGARCLSVIRSYILFVTNKSYIPHLYAFEVSDVFITRSIDRFGPQFRIGEGISSHLVSDTFKNVCHLMQHSILFHTFLRKDLHIPREVRVLFVASLPHRKRVKVVLFVDTVQFVSL